MLALLTILALQAAPAAKAEPERWSILVPVPEEPCRPSPKGDRSAANGAAQNDAAANGDVVVCGDALPSQRLPLPDEAVSTGPVPVNRELTGRGALAAAGTPCAVRQGGCQTSFGPPIVPMIVGAVGLVKDALRKHPDKSNRIPIPLDDPQPASSAPSAQTAE
jgi:hypothetical protein